MVAWTGGPYDADETGAASTGKTQNAVKAHADALTKIKRFMKDFLTRKCAHSNAVLEVKFLGPVPEPKEKAKGAGVRPKPQNRLQNG